MTETKQTTEYRMQPMLITDLKYLESPAKYELITREGYIQLNNVIKRHRSYERFLSLFILKYQPIINLEFDNSLFPFVKKLYKKFKNDFTEKKYVQKNFIPDSIDNSGLLSIAITGISFEYFFETNKEKIDLFFSSIK